VEVRPGDLMDQETVLVLPPHLSRAGGTADIEANARRGGRDLRRAGAASRMGRSKREHGRGGAVQDQIDVLLGGRAAGAGGGLGGDGRDLERLPAAAAPQQTPPRPGLPPAKTSGPGEE